VDSILARAALFQGVEATAVSALVERLSPIDVSRGHVFFREGDQGDQMFIIISGKVKIGGHSRDGREGMFTLRGPSESFGE
jgi:CRP/FNR family cyclic AMP-dependent transcriptional regulator